MSVLHILDMDGTLLRGTTASLEIARTVDCHDQVARLEQRLAEGEIDTREFAAHSYALWPDLTPGMVEEAFQRAPWIANLPRVLADIRRRGELSVVLTMSPRFFAERLTTLGADRVIASPYPNPPFHGARLNPAALLVPADKVIFAERLLCTHALSPEDCVAYGDSHSDIPLFQRLRRTVAVNATPELASIASMRYDGEDLWDAYQMARQNLCDAQVTGHGAVPTAVS